MAKKKNEEFEPLPIEEIQPMEPTETKVDEVKPLTGYTKEFNLKADEVAIRLKSGKGGLVIIKRSAFDKYANSFVIEEEGKKK